MGLEDREFLAVPERVERFIRRHHVVTLATVSERGPWCANLFYSYIPETNLFVFTSEETTRHGAEMSGGTMVAASIVLETRNAGLIRGLQMQGYVRRPSEEESGVVRVSYLKRFPYAVAAKLSLWVLDPVSMKYTDNRLGFGKKIYWRKEG